MANGCGQLGKGREGGTKGAGCCGATEAMICVSFGEVRPGDSDLQLRSWGLFVFTCLLFRLVKLSPPPSLLQPSWHCKNELQ